MRRLGCLFLAAAAIAAGDQLEEARAQLRAGHFDSAIELLQKQVAEEPSSVEASALLIEALLDAERFQEADQAIDRAIVNHPSDSRIERVLGDLRFREGRPFDAEKAYKAAIKADEHNARAIYGISRVYAATSLRKKAFQMLQVAHAIDPRDPVIARAFEETVPDTATTLARLEAELARLHETPDEADAGIEPFLKLRIAEAKALEGKPEFDPATADRAYKLPLGRLMDGRRFSGASVAVKINGAKADLRFDTGASGVIISSRFAERAGVRRLADTKISGVGNDKPVSGWVGYAPSIQIGDLELKNCLVDVPEKGSADDSNGLIGSDVFKRFLVKIDFEGQNIGLDPLPGPAWDGRTQIDRYEGPDLKAFTQMLIVHHFLLIPTLISKSVKAEQVQGLFLLDTGANLNMISTNLAPSITKVHDSEQSVRGISGKVKNVYEADKIVLQFASFRQANLGLTSFDLTGFSRSADMELSGIMGLPLIGMFASVTLDYRDGRVRFEYKK